MIKYITKSAGIAAALAIIVSVSMASACSAEGWTEEERGIILNQGEVMRILTIEAEEDSIILRRQSKDLSAKELNDDIFRLLLEKMISTLSSTDGGVGIAGPQVGISRRIVAVQRFDKEGLPIEVYPNIRIIAKRGEKVPGREGCLSVPDCWGNVPRHREIDISYTAMPEGRDTTETILDFTAVIFQHECDHLDGVLYTDLTL